MTLKELASGSFDFTTVEETLHRTKGPKARPSEFVELKSLAKETKQHTKTSKDPTPDLIELKYEDATKVASMEVNETGYCIFCADTRQIWFAHDKQCLDANFIYREDLEIKEVSSQMELNAFYTEHFGYLKNAVVSRKSCYIMDLPGNETYEVYYDSAYPSREYGYATPQGSMIHKYPNRFHRDMAILELDELYSDSSNKKAGELTARKFEQNEAIVVSDGAWMKEQSASSVYYLDSESVLHITQGRLPSEATQAVLIAEIKAAYIALNTCYINGKKKITYYYDNTSIINIFKNRKTEYIEEIKEYKDLCDKMLNEGYNVRFVEIHPKTGEERDNYNKALMFFHNRCDQACRQMCDFMKKDYKSYTTAEGGDDGKTYKQVKEENKPKGRPKQANNRPKPGGKPMTNYRR